MPRLNARGTPRIQTCVYLSQETRDVLESAIDGQDIKTLTAAVEAAAKLLAKKVKKQQATQENAP